MQRWRDSMVLQWSTLLALLVGVPWFRGGYLLAYDMVWVPTLDLGRADLWGLGSALPRAVPSDAVVALLGWSLDAALVQRGLLLGALVLAGTGGARLVAGLPLPARLAAATFAIWNPLVAERLALGQWPVLLAHAALLWLAAELLGAGRWRAWVVVLALAGTALSPATGVMGLVAVVVLGWGAGVVRLLVLTGALNAPWVVAALLRSDSLPPDTSAVQAFSLQAEGALGHLGAALSLGGIWNSDVVPVSRTLGVVALLVVLMWVVQVLGLVSWARSDARGLGRLAVLGAVGLLVACAGWLVPQLVESAIEAQPAVALLRDGSRYLLLLAPVLVGAFGHGAAALVVRLRPTSWWAAPAVLAVMLPLAALPDLAAGVAGRVTPVQYPAQWDRVRDAVASSPVVGDLLVLPFDPYRAPAWNGGRPVLDPAGRYFDRVTVTGDALKVSGRSIRGEDPRAERVRSVLAEEDGGSALGAEGIALVLVDTEASGAEEALESVADLAEVDVGEGDLRLYATEDPRETQVAPSDRLVVSIAWGAAGTVLLLGLVGAARAALGRLRSAAGGRGASARAAGRT